MIAKPKRDSKRLRLLAAVIVLIIAGLSSYYFWATPQNEASTTIAAKQPGGSEGNKGGRRRVLVSPVQTANASQQTVPRYLIGLGTVTAANTVTVTSRVEGQLMALHFTEGQQVKEGDLLAEIDPRPFKVQLTQALGQLAKDKATLANAKRDLARYQQLSKTQLISRQDLDTQLSLVQQAEGAIKVDQGAVDSAQLQLTYSKIVAPVSGRVGLKQIDMGNYISSGSTAIVVITQTHPINVVFTLPENHISDIVNAQKNGVLNVEAWDRNNRVMLTSGNLLSLDNQIDVTTGTIKLKARFSNQDDTLFPNQFVNARMQIATLENAVVVPIAAVQMGNEGHFVWAVNDENNVSKHPVTVGIQDSQIAVIERGLNTGQRVVTDGIDQLIEGMKVEVVTPQSTQPGNNKRRSKQEKS